MLLTAVFKLYIYKTNYLYQMSYDDAANDELMPLLLIVF